MTRTPSSRSALPCGNISHVMFLGLETRTFPQGAHTVADAAGAVGVAPGQIGTSLVLRREIGVDEVRAAAGSPYEVFALTPSQLVELTGGQVAEVAESASGPGVRG